MRLNWLFDFSLYIFNYTDSYFYAVSPHVCYYATAADWREQG